MRPTRILVECPELIASVRVGVLDPLKPLVTDKKCEVKFKRTLDIKKNDIAWCDTLICVRGCEYLTLKIVQAAKKAERKVVYFLDDDLLDIPKNISCSEYFDNDEIKGNLIKILEQSDINWCVNDLILEKYRKYTKGRWFTGKVPVEILQIEEKCGNSETINVLYAGSKDHTENVRKFVTPAVKILKDEFKNVRFTFIGVNPNIEESEQVIVKTYFEDYDEYKNYVKNGNFDIGLAPIKTDDFYCCKYYNKFIEYTSIGAVGVYTRSKPYTQIIIDRSNGLLCDNTVEEWYNAIRCLISNDELRKNCLKASKSTILLDFNPSKIALDLESQIPELTNYYAKEVKTQSIRLGNTKFDFYLGRLRLLWQTYKLGIIVVVPYKIVKKILKVFKIGGKKL